MKVDVAIIGAGPTGLSLANLLGRCGHSVLVIERRAGPFPMPRAIHFDGEAMRCFQAVGLVDSILPHTYVGKGMLFKDRDGNRIVDWSRSQKPGPMGWFESYRFYQPGLEFELRKGLERFDRAWIRWNADVIDIYEDGNGVNLKLANGWTVTARFAVACDGARSFTRKALDIGMEDLGFCERWLVCDLLLKRTRDDLVDHTIQYCDPDSPATYGRGARDRRRWEFRLDANDSDLWPADAVWDRLSQWITPSDATLERSAVYTFRSRVANIWRVSRIFLAGDAAHQMPPFMGQGMCAGIRDAANLWWKLRAALLGAEEASLETYQSEREVNVRAFIGKSVELGRLINQTAEGAAPRSHMESIWPDLGPGLGPRDGVGGVLAPQVRAADGTLADDTADHGFYILASDIVPMSLLPVISGADEWLRERDVTGVVIRPDGYVLGGFRDDGERLALEKIAIQYGTGRL